MTRQVDGRRTFSRRAVLRSLAAAALLVACGGGDSDDSTPTVASPTETSEPDDSTATVVPTSTVTRTASPASTSQTTRTASPTMTPTAGPALDVPSLVHYRGDARRTGVIVAEPIARGPIVRWQRQLGHAAHGSPVLAGELLL